MGIGLVGKLGSSICSISNGSGLMESDNRARNDPTSALWQFPIAILRISVDRTVSYAFL